VASAMFGQEVATKILEAALRSERVAHAYLFKGPKGSGKRYMAKEFARGILCDGFQWTGDSDIPCGKCWSCREIEMDSHPDLYHVEKDGSSIKIKTSHELLREALTRPYHSRRKVFIIHDAENLTPEAANALLKLLEEPPAYVTFILTVSNVSAIPDTVVSRCQVVPFRPLSRDAIVDILEKEHGVERERAEDIAQCAGGNIERAILLSEVESGYLDGKVLLDELRTNSPIEMAQKYSKLDHKVKSTLLSALELEFVKNINSCIAQVNANQQSYGPNMMVRPGLKDAYCAVKAIIRAKDRMNHNANSFLTLSVLFIDLARALRFMDAGVQEVHW